MLYRFSIVFLIGLCLVACSSGSMQEESVPVIRFKPDEARTLKMSRLFDGYEVLTFKGIVCNRMRSKSSHYQRKRTDGHRENTSSYSGKVTGRFRTTDHYRRSG